MTDNSKVDDAEQAYAAAAAEVKPAAKPVEAAKPVAVAKVAEVAKPVAAAKPAAVAKAAPAPKAAKPKFAKKPAARKQAVAKAKPVAAPAKTKITRKPVFRVPAVKLPVQPTPTLTQLKEAIMTTKTLDYTKPVADALGELQTRAKTAYAKSTAAMTDATEFAKGNVEAIVETGKILAGGMQGLGKTYVEEAKTAYETMTADVKELAAVKSPTELFQLQGKIARRNFDALVSTSSKNNDAFIKLMTKAFAPITDRVTLAADKLSKAA
ncbi:MAG: phasin family protein [Croceibacterium sp.]